MKKNRGYLEVKVAVPSDAFELVGLALFDLGATGLLEENDCLVAFFDADADARKLQRGVEKAAEEACRSLGVNQKPLIEVHRCQDRDWSSEWKRDWRPMRIGERLMVKPSWLDAPNDAPPIVIEIDPEMAFGSGDHATTRMTLQLIEQTVRPNDRLLDVGTGTGILSIAALKLGAAFAAALDIDPVAAMTAQKNAAVNGVADRMVVLAGGIEALRTQEFDLIAANIQRSVIVRLLPSFWRLLRMGGKCLISGILCEEEDQVRAACLGCGLKVLRVLRENEWLAFETLKA
ncbi:MAG: 50S ribosomal protein L11 methyltransferase [candidate division KSB1 bacterium]|nr:50S ribosomal protein L11 methyltransferase [candidate division KSB1 bacterium]MDZ7347081.1 50S ribosomal protein L11 methyltransferase [candidate division KSB1 bacterium]